MFITFAGLCMFVVCVGCIYAVLAMLLSPPAKPKAPICGCCPKCGAPAAKHVAREAATVPAGKTTVVL